MANEVRLIDANALVKKLREAEAKKGMGAAIAGLLIRYIEKMPTIDPESLRPKGRWVNERILIGGLAEVCGYDCSVCGKTTEIQKYNYCPHCGVRMEEF